MSAEIAILNKHAVALAADSAVTVNGKVFNRAMKLFTLSKYHPVGIMVYSSGSFMNTPWETIIKVYRSELKDQSFDTIKEYVNHFVAFLHSKHCFHTEETKKQYLLTVLEQTCGAVVYPTPDQLNGGVTIEQAIETACDNLLSGWMTTNPTCQEFDGYAFEEFEEYLASEIVETITNSTSNRNLNLNNEVLLKLRRVMFNVIVKHEQFTKNSGLVFTGFGNLEIFPSINSINIHFAVGERLKFYETNNGQISHQRGSLIYPFAQTEAMDTILTGIAPNLQTLFVEAVRQYSIKFIQKLIPIVEPTNPTLAIAIQGIDIEGQVAEFNKELGDRKFQHYILPLMNAIANLSKEDLAEMAESLIYLTYLQKRITFALEDVGGAVDVAVISKGDGFIWIKRKHYFKPELNQFFFENYFK
jgi:hypothetical protein